MSFPPPIESLTLRVTTGVYPDVQPFEQTILSANMGSNSIPIHNTSLTSAFNTQSPWTIFNASILTTYTEGTFTTGDTISTPSLLNFAPNPLVLSNFGPFSYNYVWGGVGTFTLPQPSSNSNSPGAFTYSVVGTTGIVSVSTNVVTMLSAGTTTIRATQAAAGNYTSAYFEDSFNVMTWGQRGQDINGEAAGDYSGWSVSLSSSGNTVAVGAIYNDGTGTNSGHTRVYDWDTVATPNKWTKRGSDIDGESAGDLSGVSVSISSDGNTVAIGGHYNDGTGLDAGHVRVYDWNSVSWTKRGSDIDGEAANDQSGVSVSISSDGNTVAIGARYNDGAGLNAGHARVYDWDTTSWRQLGLDIDGEATGDNSGRSVSLSSDGNILVVGAVYNDGNGTSSGQARVFKYE